MPPPMATAREGNREGCPYERNIMTDSKHKEAPVEKAKTAAEIYHELVHTDIAGWPEKKIVEHKRKCAEALAAKQKTS